MQRVIGKMARMYPLFILMGIMVVVAALVIGYINSQTAATYYSESKAAREVSLLAERASIESTGAWLPYFKFLGIGLILGGIVMALRVIIDHLQAAGRKVLSNLPVEQRPRLPKPPWLGLLMPLVMMAGWAIFIVALVVSLNVSSTAAQLFANPVAAIDAAGNGSVLLSQLQGVHATAAWLVPFKFFGVATEFLAIVMGLGTIIYILTEQTRLIGRAIQIGRKEKAA
jgi:hypothetical protein